MCTSQNPFELLYTKYRYGSTITDLNIEPYPITFPALRTANFTPYNLFCLLSKLNNVVSKSNPSLYVKLVQYRDGDEMVMTPQIYNGFDKLNPYDASIVLSQRDVNTITEYMPDYFILFSSDRDIEYMDTSLPKSWIRSILKYIVLPVSIDINEYDNMCATGSEPELLDTNRTYGWSIPIISTYIGNTWYVKCPTDHNNVYDTLTRLIMTQLVAWYEMGCIILDKDKDDMFISAWQLENMDNTQIYKPYWTNVLLTGNDCVSFLYDRLNGIRLNLNIHNSNKSVIDQIKQLNVNAEFVYSYDEKTLERLLFIPTDYAICDQILSILD